MSRYVADGNKFGMLIESGTYATTSGAGIWVGQVQDHTPDESFPREMIRYQGANTRNVSAFADLVIDLAGTFNYYPQNWRMLGYALGSNVDAGAAGSYTHTMSETESTDGNAFTSGTTAPFMSFGLVDVHQFNPTGLNFIRNYNGCMVDSFSLTASQGEILNCEVGYIAQEVSTGSSGLGITVTADTARPYIYADTVVHWPSGTKVDYVNSWGLTINNNLEAKHYANGSKEVYLPQPLNRDYELSISVDSTSDKAYEYYNQYYKGGSEFNLLLEVNIASPAKKLFVSLSGCEITQMETPSPIEGLDEQTMTITPKTCSAVATDAISSYNPW